MLNSRSGLITQRGLEARVRMDLEVCLVLAVLALALLQPVPPVAAHASCSRIGVESRDGRVLLSSYTVAEPDYVARIHRLIDQNGEDGTWTVAAGELGSVGYTVTYTCLG